MNFYTFSEVEFKKLLSEAAETGATNALINAGLSSPIIWRSEAIRLHGEKLLNRFEKYNLIERRQHYPRGNYYYDVKELNYALVTERRHRFFIENNK